MTFREILTQHAKQEATRALRRFVVAMLTEQAKAWRLLERPAKPVARLTGAEWLPMLARLAEPRMAHQWPPVEIPPQWWPANATFQVGDRFMLNGKPHEVVGVDPANSCATVAAHKVNERGEWWRA